MWQSLPIVMIDWDRVATTAPAGQRTGQSLLARSHVFNNTSASTTLLRADNPSSHLHSHADKRRHWWTVTCVCAAQKWIQHLNWIKGHFPICSDAIPNQASTWAWRHNKCVNTWNSSSFSSFINKIIFIYVSVSVFIITVITALTFLDFFLACNPKTLVVATGCFPLVQFEEILNAEICVAEICRLKLFCPFNHVTTPQIHVAAARIRNYCP